MRKSLELVLLPNPLSGIARISPGSRPSTIAEKPSTGWEASGKVMPLIVCPAKKPPAGGPGAYVSTDSTALPTNRGTVASLSSPCAAAGSDGTSVSVASAPAYRSARRVDPCPLM